jgi:hypothetical protein
MVPSDILQRVLLLKYGNGTATAFSVEVDNYQFLITAKHAVPNIEHSGQIEIFHNDQWKGIAVTAIYCDIDEVDIIALFSQSQLTPIFPTNFGLAADLYVSQDVYFCGFPYGWSNYAGQVNNGHPLPFVKKAICSAFGFIETEAGMFAEKVYLDGHNNPGFSGGPVSFLSKNTGKQTIAGVISGYHWQAEPIQSKKNPEEAEQLYYQANTGIIVAYNMSPIIAAIQKFILTWKQGT